MVVYKSEEELKKITNLVKAIKKKVWDAEVANASNGYPVTVKIARRESGMTFYVKKNREWGTSRYRNYYSLLNDKKKVIAKFDSDDSNDTACGYFPLAAKIKEIEEGRN